MTTYLFHLLSRDTTIDRLEGGFLLGAMVAFTAYAVWLGRKSATAAEQETFEEIATASFGRTGSSAVASNVAAIALGVALLAGGIWEALITTAAGLCVAIPTVIFYHYFETGIDGIVKDINENITEFMDLDM